MITFCGSKASGQDATGRITGIVYDATGAVERFQRELQRLAAQLDSTDHQRVEARWHVLQLAKVTPLYRERITLELRVDAFNIFNHTQFQNLDVNAQDVGTAIAPGTFGQAISAYDPRILQVAAHLRF